MWSATVPVTTGSDDLTTDFAFYPAPHTSEKLLILSSGVHGVEGFAGSAVQIHFLRTMLQSTLNSDFNVLLIHAVNPYGFKHRIRYAEGRVDLNRNWFNQDVFPRDIPDGDYDQFRPLLEPAGPATHGVFDFAWFLVTKLLPQMSSIQSGLLTKAAGQGQYRFPHGFEYGGNAFEPNKQIFLSQVNPYLEKFRHILMVDLHTGLGRRTLQVLPNPPLNEQQKAWRSKVFEVDGKSIESTGSADFYMSFGGFSDFVCLDTQTRYPGHQCLDMLLEYGTLIEDGWKEWPLGLGGLKSMVKQAYTLYLGVRENQMAQYGAKTPQDQTAINQELDDLFYPKDQVWRSMVLREATRYLPQFLARFNAQPSAPEAAKDPVLTK